MHLNLRDWHLKYSHIEITVYKPHGNYKPKIYNTHKKREKIPNITQRCHQTTRKESKRRKKQKELQKQPKTTNKMAIGT